MAPTREETVCTDTGEDRASGASNSRDQEAEASCSAVAAGALPISIHVVFRETSKSGLRIGSRFTVEKTKLGLRGKTTRHFFLDGVALLSEK